LGFGVGVESVIVGKHFCFGIKEKRKCAWRVILVVLRRTCALIAIIKWGQEE